jgi:VIT1/CCC1 family predicted Fe2+/Mn2+ transporter
MAKLTRTVRRMRRFMLPWGMRPQHGHQEDHRWAGSVLREVVFGANDGLVSNVSLVAGVAGATSDSKTVLLAGVAGVVAGAISMSLGAYVSTKSEREFREAEERRERWEVEHMPREEKAEVREIYVAKGITGPTLDAIVEQITRDKEQWVQTMMQDELGFSDEPPRPLLAAVMMGIAFTIAALFPVAPFVFMEGAAALTTAVGLTGVALLGVGAWRAYITAGNVWRKAFEMVGLAAVAVAAANLIGRLVGVGIY